MRTIVSNYTKQLWTTNRRTKTAPTGFISGNAVCCIHSSETLDTKGRGGLTAVDGSVFYHCFNCTFTASFTPGYPLSYKFRKLLTWMGASDNDIKRLIIDVLRIKQIVSPGARQYKKEEIVFLPRSLPGNSVELASSSSSTSIASTNASNYVNSRKIDTSRYQFYLSDAPTMKNRIIVPFKWKGDIVGCTARSMLPTANIRYINNYPAHYVFNVNMQKYNAKFVIVTEGPFDAMSIDGVAVMGNTISTQQAEIIGRIAHKIIVVPDRGTSGQKLIDSALNHGWNVSFPVWLEGAHDVNESLQLYGKLFTLQAILQASERSNIKIEVLRKKIRDE